MEVDEISLSINAYTTNGLSITEIEASGSSSWSCLERPSGNTW